MSISAFCLFFMFYLPFYLVTGSELPYGDWRIAWHALCSCLAATALMDRFARHHFKRVSLGLFLLLQMPLVCLLGHAVSWRSSPRSIRCPSQWRLALYGVGLVFLASWQIDRKSCRLVFGGIPVHGPGCCLQASVPYFLVVGLPSVLEEVHYGKAPVSRKKVLRNSPA